MQTLITVDGTKIKVRQYKNDDRQEKYNYTRSFNRVYKKMSFEKYANKIIRDTVNDFTYFQFDSTRIYLDNTPIDGNKGLKYIGLVESGLLYPTIIFCALDKSCSPRQDSIQKMIFHKDTLIYTEQYIGFDKDWLKKKYGWTGNKIYLSNIKELPYLEKSNTRVFELEHKIYHGGPTDAYYYIEITNDLAKKKTSLPDFVKGARLTFIEHTWTTLEI